MDHRELPDGIDMLGAKNAGLARVDMTSGLVNISRPMTPKQRTRVISILENSPADYLTVETDDAATHSTVYSASIDAGDTKNLSRALNEADAVMRGERAPERVSFEAGAAPYSLKESSTKEYDDLEVSSGQFSVGDKFRQIKYKMEKAEKPVIQLAQMNKKNVDAARSIFDSWTNVVASDGNTILLANPEKGLLSRRLGHLLAGKDGTAIELDRLRWLPIVPETLRNAGAVLDDKEKGTHIYVRRYAGDRNGSVFHFVVVGKDGGVDESNAVYDKPLATQFASEFPGRRNDLPVLWEQKEARSSEQGASSLTADSGAQPSQQRNQSIPPSTPEVKFPENAAPYSIESNDMEEQDYGEEVRYSIRKGPEPSETIRAYKLMRVKKKSPGKLFPLFVGASQETPMNVWLDADEGNNLKTKLGTLAKRPGWHAADLPGAFHIGKKGPDGKINRQHPDTVWVEVEMAADQNWQEEANRRAKRNKKGEIIPKTAHITDQIPRDGYYRYKTNPNMKGDWIIGGAMKMVRILEDSEVDSLLRENGVNPLPREGGPIALEKYGLKPSPKEQKDQQQNAAPFSLYGPEVKKASGGKISDDGYDKLVHPTTDAEGIRFSVLDYGVWRKDAEAVLINSDMSK